MGINAVSVSQLNNYVSSLLNNDPNLKGIVVEGEISGIRRYSSGHYYFALKDASAVVRCVLFASSAARLKFEPKDGMNVYVKGSVSLYERDGQFQINVTGMKPIGEGELYRRFLELKAKLESEGLFLPEHKKPLPMLPKCVGVITSRSGAAYHDIVSVTKRRFPSMNILLCHSAVQGVDAPAEIVTAIKKMDKLKLCDVLIVGRGGGSIEELWSYNDEGVARAIFDCSIPIISAVGHETDFTIADFVADFRAPTPSAAAELASPDYAALTDRIVSTASQLYQITNTRIIMKRMAVTHLIRQASLDEPVRIISNVREKLIAKFLEMRNTMESRLQNGDLRFRVAKAKLDSSSPYKVLERGYAIVRDNDGSIVSTAKTLHKSAKASVQFADGTVHVDVIQESEG